MREECLDGSVCRLPYIAGKHIHSDGRHLFQTEGMPDIPDGYYPVVTREGICTGELVSGQDYTGFTRVDWDAERGELKYESVRSPDMSDAVVPESEVPPVPYRYKVCPPIIRASSLYDMIHNDRCDTYETDVILIAFEGREWRVGRYYTPESVEVDGCRLRIRFSKDQDWCSANDVAESIDTLSDTSDWDQGEIDAGENDESEELVQQIAQEIGAPDPVVVNDLEVELCTSCR